ncbi:serine hydrolase domain-containing protein [Algimonas porphyrae]|uniref:Serine hydrolase n=1 Tax=Algimonas porphyrae TaxID=1128113 RepID=A0ABQ5V460_9PROT|nr:serine hydrolase domain-containing protein [Algimonas porphyrae]GLQ21381.1 serine hydrolase [Algimonas porphyrae]
MTSNLTASARGIAPLLFGLTLLSGCETVPPAVAVPELTATSEAATNEAACHVTAPVPSPAIDKTFSADMDRLMTHMIDRGIAPGAVIAINRNGETIFTQAYGYADLETGKPMTTDSLFRIYSMTKPVTTIAALQLVDRGLIALDDPISDHLPDFAKIRVATDETGTNVRAPSRAPTVRDLMRHTTGLTYRTGAKADPIAAYYAELGIPAGPGVSDVPTNGMDPVIGNDGFISRIVQAPLKHDPGQGFTYGNSTDVLGALVAKVSGQPLSEYMQDNIFDPLGMEDSHFRITPDRIGDFTSAYIVPPQAPSGSPIDYNLPIDELQPQTPYRLDPYDSSLYAKAPDFEFGGAGLVSDADDYLAFTQALIDAEPRLVSETLWQEATRDQLSAEARASAAFLGKRGFGLGFAVRDAETLVAPVFPQCGLFWAGAASTYFWIDEETDTTGVFMTQVFESDVRSYFGEILARIYAEGG